MPVDHSVPAPIVALDSSVTAIVGTASQGRAGPVALTSLAELEAEYGAADGSVLGRATSEYLANGGREALVARAVDPDGAAGALQRLESGPPFQLLVVDVPGEDVQDAAYALCERVGAFLVLDAPADGAVPAGLGADAGVYHPRLEDAAGNERPCAPSVAGVIARIDLARGVWKAPAGLSANVVGAAALTRDLDDRDLAELAGRHVNCLRTMPDGTVVVWGARTASQEEEWCYVSVRRLHHCLGRSIREGLAWVAGEPNAEPLWAQVRRLVGDFLTAAWRQGGLVGERPSQAFFVRCGTDTMTRDDIDAGRLVVLAGIAPLHPAEFVTLRIERTAAAPVGAPPRR